MPSIVRTPQQEALEEKLKLRWRKWEEEINQKTLTAQMLYLRHNETCNRGWTYMHYVCRYGTFEQIKKVVQPLNHTQKLNLFNRKNKISQATPLMKLALKHEFSSESANMKDCLELIFSSLSHDAKFRLLSTVDVDGMNIIAYAASLNHVAALEHLMAHFKFNPDQQLNLMNITWRYESVNPDSKSLSEESGYGSDDQAGEKEPSTPAEWAQFNGHTKMVELLEDLRMEALLADALKTNNHTERSKKAEELIQNDPMTPDQVEALSFSLNKYILPSNQNKSRRHALIFYTTDCRDGAIQEARNLEQSFEMLDHEVYTVQWTDAQSFRDEYSNHLERIKSNCCFLTLCIMAHGSTGAVRGSDGSAVPVNHILYELTHTLPTHVPVVIIIQACQQSSPPISGTNTDARIGSPDNNTFIDLKRPHTLLLMSTVAGGTALRGAYTGALARQFRMADGKTSIQDMHCKAVQEMNGGYQWQVAESRCTLIRGSLVLPRPTCTSHQRVKD